MTGRRGSLPANVAMVCFAAFAPISALSAQTSGESHVTAELVAVAGEIRPGEPVTLEIRLTVDGGWYIYGPEAGDVGLPLGVQWRGPAGFRAGATEWPATRRKVENGATAHFYEGEVVVRGALIPPADLTTGAVRVGATVRWAACRDVCIPSEATLFVDLLSPPR